MTTPLHDLDVYRTLAEGAPGRSRDWALTHLALHGEPIDGLPHDPELLPVILAAAPRALALVEPKLRGGTDETLAAAIVGTVSGHGIGIEPSWLRTAVESSDPDSALWYAWMLARMGQCEPGQLARAGAATTLHKRWLLPLVVLDVSKHAGQLDAGATAIAAELNTLAEDDPSLWEVVLASAGVAVRFHQGAPTSLERALTIGAETAGGVPQHINSKGSLQVRISKIVRSLLEGVPGTQAALLRAAATTAPPQGWSPSLVASAAWVKAQATPSADADPIDAVLHRGAGADFRALAAARTAVADTDAGRIIAAMAVRPDLAPVVIAPPLLHGEHGDAVATAVMQLHRDIGGSDARVQVVAEIAASRFPDLVAPLLAQRNQRHIGLSVAHRAHSIETLQALIDMPVPADVFHRERYAWCLAETADAAAAHRLQQLIAMAPRGSLDHVKSAAEQLMGMTLGPAV